MALIKIPVIILVNMAFKTIMAHHIPKRALKSDPVVPTSTLEKKIWVELFLKSYIFQTTFSVLEIAMILANKFLHSYSILSKIVFSSNAVSHQPHTTLMSAIGAVFVAADAIIRLRAYEAMGDMFIVDVTIKKDHRLIQTGIYSIVQHPSYTGYMVAVIGWIMWNLAEGSWLKEPGLLETRYRTTLALRYAVFISFGVPIATPRIPREDAALKQRFGKEWEDWAKKVPYRLLPGIF